MKNTLQNRSLTTGIVLLISWMITAPSSLAQDATSEPVLPDIAPREIEIKGELEVSFPSLQRQPLLGFYPPPRIAEISRSRQPFAEEYKQNSVDLPESPLQRPTVPSITSFDVLDNRYGELEIAAGNHFSRTSRIRIGQPISSNASLHGSLDYSGTDGSDVFGVDPDILNPNDSFAGSLGYRTTGKSISASVAVDGFSDSYTLYSLENAESYGFAEPKRIGSGLGLSLSVASGTAVEIPAEAVIRIARSSHESELLNSSGSVPAAFDRIEQRIDGKTTASLPLGGSTLDVAAELGAANQDNGEDEAASTAYTMLSAGLSFQNRNVDFTAAPAFIASFFNPSVNTAGSSERIIYLTANFRASFSPGENMTVYVKNDPTIDRAVLSDTYLHAPYQADEPDLQPVLYPFKSQAGVKLFLGKVTLRGFAGYTFSPNYRHWRRPVLGEVDSQFGLASLVVADYDDADIFHGGGEFTVVASKSLSFGSTAQYQRGYLGSDDLDIPHFPRIVGSLYATANHGRWFARAEARGQSSTYADLAKQVELDPASAAMWKIRYNIANNIGLTLAGKHHLGSDIRYWEGYPVTPHTILGGVRITW